MDNRKMKRVEVLGSQMAYVHQGQGPTDLFVYGNPTSSYLWRNVIPHVAPNARCSAPDLIGFGESAKPDVPYRAANSSRFLRCQIAGTGKSWNPHASRSGPICLAGMLRTGIAKANGRPSARAQRTLN